jgi:hypothetical protein
MASFEQNGLRFEMDREGVEIPAPQEIQLDVDYEDLGIDPEDAASVVGRRLSALTESSVHDEEGLYDLAVRRDGTLVAALVLACEEDALSLGGERVAEIDDEALAEALVAALTT